MFRLRVDFYRQIFGELILFRMYFKDGTFKWKQSVFQIGVLHPIQASKDIVKSVQNVYF